MFFNADKEGVTMKKWWIVLALMLILCVGMAAAETSRDGNWEYFPVGDGTVEITGYLGSAEELVIPAEIDGSMVSRLGNACFMGNATLCKVTIPDAIVNVHNNPFVGCTKLTEIVVSIDHPTLATIDGVLFYKPDKRLVTYPCAFTAQTYTVPEGIRDIGGSAFCQSRLTGVTLPSTLTAVSDGAFAQSAALESIVIPDSVGYVGGYTFRECAALRSVQLPANLEIIDHGVFENCVSLTGITIPDKVTDIRGYAFNGCTALAEIVVSIDHPALATIDGVLFRKSDKTLLYYPAALTAESYTIPTGIRRIGDSAFCENPVLKEVIFPDTVTEIGSSAFSGCAQLNNVVLPGSVTKVEHWAFFNCHTLTDITVPAGVTEIGDNAFISYYCPMTIHTWRGTAAAQWAKDNGVAHDYKDALDWLTN